MGEDDAKHRDALTAAGYTSLRGAFLFCALMALVGGAVGSVVIAIIWNALVPGSSETMSTAIGAAAGAVLLALIAAFKVRQGNLEALEQVEDKEWRRHLRRQHGR
ncbi:MAG: hypothetical protein JNN24_11280 [Hyphomicrobium zavarzinii]|jgi:outer membrane lipoprotein SlyB|uniref:hypothetical protein n=1 Tax=Hyphomicrobium TaxID=81 RepID=UPI00039A59E5|nr:MULTISPECIES: hypothetical protein [Hyphomicrobium]MBL8846339.1 hypothetical protein [Hyphomicrobium zavarzinii]WBT38327.1 hypothetical protein PE058_00175 [Hyphomicrobium sp. DMF-1]HML41765.1 hypothetical protein [Hyphomicrobium zavarzinii]